MEDLKHSTVKVKQTDFEVRSTISMIRNLFYLNFIYIWEETNKTNELYLLFLNETGICVFESFIHSLVGCLLYRV